jgi:aryl-alcohol dehydrogenase-like predicted oxidoreductase
VIRRHLAGREVHPIGLGGLPLSAHPELPPGRARDTVAAALASGVGLIDTAASYAPGPDAMGHNERLVAETLRELGVAPSTVMISTKGGVVLEPGSWRVDGSPEHLRRACEESLRLLGVEAIDLYQLHRPDPQRPIAESVGALEGLRREGKIRSIGLSNVDVEQLHAALDVAPVAAVQNELSLRFTASIDGGVLAACLERGIAFLAWSPLGGMGAQPDGPALAVVREVAVELDAAPQQVMLAWVLAQGPHVVALVGASRPETIRASAAAASLELTAGQLARLSAAAAAHPDRSAYG